jgi:hypothetical protein
MRYFCSLLLCGFAWWGVSLSLLDYVSPSASLIASCVTALVVGFALRRHIQDSSKSARFALPLLSMLIALVTYGVTEPAAEWLVGGHTWNAASVEPEAFYGYPFSFVLYGFSLFIWLLYPLALATHYALRKWALPPASAAT